MKYQICKRCVMDTSDPSITFDEYGYCNYCNYSLTTMVDRWVNGPEGKKKLDIIASKIKQENINKKYDCMIGLSGGLDSSYLAYYMKKEYDLRMLALHIDTGWNTIKAEENIKKICDKMDIDLVVEKLNEEEFMDLQRAFFLSGVQSQDSPQDHMFAALLFKYAKDNGIKYFLSGANFSSENILQKGEGHIAADKVYLLDIHKKFGRVKIRTLPTISLFERYIKYKFINKIKMIRPLDYIDYRIKDAIKELEETIGYEYYGGKHYESVFTKFFQEYYLPKRYNFDKRKSHLSSLIVTNQMTRDEALEILQKPLYEDIQIEKDIDYIIKKIDITRIEFDDLMKKSHNEAYLYKKSKWIKLRKLAVKNRVLLGE